MMNLTDPQLRILRHMLGIDVPYVKVPIPTRNYYCANQGDEQLKDLERRGAVRWYSRHDGYDWYRCTTAGRVAAMASHKNIQWTKPKRLYRRFLKAKDAMSCLSFKEFLIDPEFAEMRRAA